MPNNKMDYSRFLKIAHSLVANTYIGNLLWDERPPNGRTKCKICEVNEEKSLYAVLFQLTDETNWELKIQLNDNCLDGDILEYYEDDSDNSVLKLVEDLHSAGRKYYYLDPPQEKEYLKYDILQELAKV